MGQMRGLAVGNSCSGRRDYTAAIIALGVVEAVLLIAFVAGLVAYLVKRSESKRRGAREVRVPKGFREAEEY